jgi:hypothetical protein
MNSVLIWLRLASGRVVAWGAQYQLTLATGAGDVRRN